MIHIHGPIPKNITVAVSGGVDSMALLDFFSLRQQVSVAFFDHGTATSSSAKDFLIKVCRDRDIKNLHIERLKNQKPKELSLEEHWRNERYAFLSKFQNVATAHTLDDCVETWIWGSLHGTPKLIPYRRGNVFRPFLRTRKSELISWCTRKGVDWLEDPSNLDTKFTRNFIRHKLMPGVLEVNPGIHKVISKKLEAELEYPVYSTT